MSREPSKVGCVGGRERCLRAERDCGDHAIHERSASPARLVEESRAQDRVFLDKGNALGNEASRQVQVFGLHGAAQELGPGDYAHPERLALLQPVSQPAILGGAMDEASDQEACVEMDHLDSRRVEEARRSDRVCFDHRAAVLSSRPRARCSALRAASAPGAGSCPAVRIARRRASDLLTPRRRAMSSRVRTVSTSRA